MPESGRSLAPMTPAFSTEVRTTTAKYLATRDELASSLGAGRAVQYEWLYPRQVLDNWGVITLEIEEVLWGEPQFSEIEVFGVLVPHASMSAEVRTVPRIAATNADTACEMIVFANDAPHLLFLVRTGILNIGAAPTAEAVTGPDDPWARWATHYLRNLDLGQATASKPTD